MGCVTIGGNREGGVYTHHKTCGRSCDHRPSHPYNTGTEHVGFSPTRKALLARGGRGRDRGRRAEVMGRARSRCGRLRDSDACWCCCNPIAQALPCVASAGSFFGSGKVLRSVVWVGGSSFCLSSIKWQPRFLCRGQKHESYQYHSVPKHRERLGYVCVCTCVRACLCVMSWSVLLVDVVSENCSLSLPGRLQKHLDGGCLRTISYTHSLLRSAPRQHLARAFLLLLTLQATGSARFDSIFLPPPPLTVPDTACVCFRACLLCCVVLCCTALSERRWCGMMKRPWKPTTAASSTIETPNLCSGRLPRSPSTFRSWW